MNISNNKKQNYILKLRVFIIIMLVFVIIILGLTLGVGNVSIADVFNIAMHKILGFELEQSIKSSSVAIVWDIRLPRVLLAFIVGAALSTAGAVLQSTLKNPLASSYTLGVSAGAALGASIALSFGIFNRFAIFTVPIFALLFAMATIFVIILFSAKVDRQMSSSTIILTGIVFSIFINALQSLLMSFSADNIKNILFWQMGSFSFKGFEYIFIIASITLVCIMFLYSKSMELDILTFGEESATIIGVNQKAMKWLFIFITTILTGVAVAFVGIIGFVDLIAPHITRKIFGSGHKKVLIFSALIGGIFMVVSDIISRLAIYPREIPIGIITALFGAPFFAYIYFIKREKP